MLQLVHEHLLVFNIGDNSAFEFRCLTAELLLSPEQLSLNPRRFFFLLIQLLFQIIDFLYQDIYLLFFFYFLGFELTPFSPQRIVKWVFYCIAIEFRNRLLRHVLKCFRRLLLKMFGRTEGRWKES